jgi:hypothetical protein
MLGKWVRNSSLVGAVLVAGMAMASPGNAAPGAALPAFAPMAENVTFWAQPFPYGYRARHSSCVRHVRVKTPDGMRVRRVWVCR